MLKVNSSSDTISISYTDAIRKAAAEYIDYGFQIVPLRTPGNKFKGKEPYHSDWPNRKFHIDDLSDTAGGFGLKTGIKLPDESYFLVWDIDIYNKDQKISDEILQVLNIGNDNTYQITASGGFHYFFKTDYLFSAGNYRLDNGVIELKSKGQQIVAAPTRAMGKDGVLRSYVRFGHFENIPFHPRDRVQGILDDLDRMSVSGKQEGSKQGTPREYSKRNADTVAFYRQESTLLLKKYSTEDVLRTLELHYEEASPNYYKVNCPLHTPDENPSLIVYKNSGICFDTHDNKSYSLVDFIGELSSNPQEYIFDKFGISTGVAFNRYETKKPIEELIGVRGEVILFDGKITFETNTDAINKVIKMLQDQHNYHMVARTASGKSYAIINTAKQLNLKMIYLVPYEVIASQFGDKKYNLPAIYEGISLEHVSCYLESSDIIISTYDGLEKILELNFIPYNYLLVIDEYHDLCTHSNFRFEVIRRISECERQFKKIIRITGTPEGVISPDSDFKTVIFKNMEEKPRIKGKYEIVCYHDHGDEKVITHLVSKPIEGKVILFKNNIDSLKILREGLLNRGIPEEHICILHAQEKDQDDYKSIVENQVITDKTKYILTTSVISDGVDINNKDIDALYFVDCLDLILARQLLGRFREGVENVYDFISANREGYDGWYELEAMIKSKSKHLSEIVNSLEQFLSSSVSSNDVKINIIPHIFRGANENLSLCYYNKLTDTLQSDLFQLRASELSKMNAVMLHWPERRKEYLKAFEYIDAEISEWSLLAENLEMEKERINRLHLSIVDRTKQLLIDEREKVITAFLRVMSPDEYVLHKDSYSCYLLNDFDYETYFKFHKQTLNSKIAYRVIKNYLRLSVRGFEKKDALDLCTFEKQKIDKILKTLDCLKILKIFNKYNGFQNMGRKSLGLIDYEIIKFMTSYLKKRPEFPPEDLCNKLNEYLKTKKISIRLKQPEVTKIALMIFELERKNGYKRFFSRRQKKYNYYRYVRQITPDDINSRYLVNLNTNHIEALIKKEIYDLAKRLKTGRVNSPENDSIIKKILENEYE